jgi:5-(carboxyamino)imidazole ribonucleotide synthase
MRLKSVVSSLLLHPLQPGDTIGILGGGQLGRMLALAAAQLGLKTHIYAPEEDSPAFDVATRITQASYEDEEALRVFAESVDVVTYEFENIPLKTAQFVERLNRLHPGAKALSATQDRLIEKQTIAALGLATAPFKAVDQRDDLVKAIEVLGTPSILKTRCFGYDGKGQVMIRAADEAKEAYASLQGAPAILEGFVPFTREISVVAVRAANGAFAAYDVCENIHAHHILSETRLPAAITPATHQKALNMAQSLADALDYVGVLAVEMFVTQDENGAEALIINEMAPRVHNSGHWTLEGAKTSQFEQHIRAICGWPLGSCKRLGTVMMRNLIGVDVDQWQALLQNPDNHLHLYGKSEARQGRKMGHVTQVMAL